MSSLAVKNIYKTEFSLEKIGKNLIQYLKQLGFFRAPIIFYCFGSKWSASFYRIYEKQGQLEEIPIDWGGGNCIVRIPLDWPVYFSSHIFGFDQVFDLPEELKTFAFEVCATEFFDLIENCTRKRFVLKKTINDQIKKSLTYGFNFQINDGNHDFNIEFWVDDLALGFLSNAIRGIEKYKSESDFWNEIPIPVRFLVGWTEVPKNCIKDINLHDVIFLDEFYLLDQKFLRIFFGNTYSAVAEISGTKFIIRGCLEKVLKDMERSNSNEDIDLDDLQVCLSFDLGERILTLGELRSINSGYVFELGRDVRHAVSIRANGKYIGEGELVDIDGNVGVSVLRLSGRD